MGHYSQKISGHLWQLQTNQNLSGGEMKLWIARLLCATFGHLPCLEVSWLLSFYSKVGDHYVHEGKLYHCPRCKERVFAGKGVLLVEVADLITMTLKDLRKIT